MLHDISIHSALFLNNFNFNLCACWQSIFKKKLCLTFSIASVFDFIECFTTTFLRAHSWLNWVEIASV